MSLQSKSQEKPLDYYIGLSYPIEIQKAEEGGFVVSIPLLPGCITQVEKWEEAESSIEEVRKEWLKAAYEDGVEIPLPKTEKDYSGKFVLRISKSMHRKLDMRAEEEGISLNKLLVQVISQYIATPKTEIAPSTMYSRREVSWILLAGPKKGSVLRDSKPIKQLAIIGSNIGGIESYERININ